MKQNKKVFYFLLFAKRNNNETSFVNIFSQLLFTRYFYIFFPDQAQYLYIVSIRISKSECVQPLKPFMFANILPNCVSSFLRGHKVIFYGVFSVILPIKFTTTCYICDTFIFMSSTMNTISTNDYSFKYGDKSDNIKIRFKVKK